MPLEQRHNQDPDLIASKSLLPICQAIYTVSADDSCPTLLRAVMEELITASLRTW
jgi:hypothetical protein